MDKGNGFENGVMFARWILSRLFRKKAKELRRIYDDHRSFWYNPKYLLEKAGEYEHWAWEIENLEEMGRSFEELRLV